MNICTLRDLSVIVLNLAAGIAGFGLAWLALRPRPKVSAKEPRA